MNFIHELKFWNFSWECFWEISFELSSRGIIDLDLMSGHVAETFFLL